MTDRWLTYTRLDHVSGNAATFLPGNMLYYPRIDAFARIISSRDWKVYDPKADSADIGGVLAFVDTITVHQSWLIHFYGRLMQVVSAFQCAWREWRKDCL